MLAAPPGPTTTQPSSPVPASGDIPLAGPDPAQRALRAKTMPRAAFPDARRLLNWALNAFRSPYGPLVNEREFYQLAQTQIAGPWWKNTHRLRQRPASERVPYSAVGEMVRTYAPHLMGEALLPVVEPSGIGDRGSAKILEYRLRQWSKDANYAREDEKRVIDALIGVGVTYVSRRDGGIAVATEETTLDLGQPMVQRVSIENMVVDPICEDFDRASGIGHWYAVDRQSLLDAGIGREELIESIPNIWTPSEETKGLGRYPQGTWDQFLDDKILLWEVCFRYGNRFFCCTLPPFRGMDEFVVEPYEVTNEPEGSRYSITTLNRLPDYLQSISPAKVMMDAHLALQGITSKIVEQIEELERKYVGEPGTQNAILRLKQRGGDAFLTAKGKIQEFVKGGMVKEAVEAFSFLKALGQQIGPNTDLAGGRADPSNSATVGSIMAGNGAVAMGYWKNALNTSRVNELRRVAALLQQGSDTQTYMFPTSAGPVPLVWNPDFHDLSYDEYLYKIKATSPNGAMDARAKLRSLFEIGTMLPPFMQFFCGMLGAPPDRVLRVVSDLSEMQELDEILPTGDMASIQQRMFQMLASKGFATPTGMPGAGPPMGGAGPGPGLMTGGASAPSLSSVPGKVALMNSDNAAR